MKGKRKLFTVLGVLAVLWVVLGAFIRFHWAWVATDTRVIGRAYGTDNNYIEINNTTYQRSENSKFTEAVKFESIGTVTIDGTGNEELEVWSLQDYAAEDVILAEDDDYHGYSYEKCD